LKIKLEGALLLKLITPMKNKFLILLCLLTLAAGSLNSARASVDNSLEVVGDLALVRPGCFAVTIVGTAIFVVALPFAAMSGSLHDTANTLVIHPAEATFTRPLGDFTTLN
jgi:hypothetical protein